MNTMGNLPAGGTGCRGADGMRSHSDGGFPGGDLLDFKTGQVKWKCSQEEGPQLCSLEK
jgi:hypothetical protein